MTIVYIAAGSNLNSPSEQVNSAVSALKSILYLRVIAISSYYRTSPLGTIKTQPDYLNIAIALETDLDAEVLLDKTQKIELQQGRIRTSDRWGPRTLDLDIMLFGNKIINTDRLVIPHYDMKNRAFMLWPLFEIAPRLCFPDGELLETALIRLGEKKPPHW